MKKLLLLAGLVGAGCSHAPLADAPKPGIIGEVRLSTDDNSTAERVTYATAVPEFAVRLSFETYLSRQRTDTGLRTRLPWYSGVTQPT